MNNQTKYTYAAVALIVIAVVAFFIYTSGQNSEVANESNNTNRATPIQNDRENQDMMPSNTPDATTNTETVEQGRFSGEEDIMSPDVQVFEISYDGKAYTPSSLTIKNGDVVIFKNESGERFWPASAPHPQHTDYPEFDPKTAVDAGGKFEFKFTKSGTWKFHDHIKPSAFGSITVQ